MVSRDIAGALFSVALVASGGANAQPAPDARALVPIVGTIDVRSSDPCLDVRAIAAQISRWLQRDAIDARVNVLLRPAEPGAGESIEIIRDGEVVAERQFDAGEASCAERQAALGLMIALALDATLIETLETEPVVAAPVTPSEPVVVPSEVAPIRYRLDVSLVSGFGILPSSSVGAAITLERAFAQRLALRFGAFGMATPAVSLERGRVSSALVAVRFDVCAGADVGRLRAEGCGVLLGGAMLARGRGFSVNERALVPWLALAVGAAGRVALGERFGLRLGLDLVVPVLRTELVVTDIEGTTVALRTPPAVGAAFSLGVGVTFP